MVAKNNKRGATSFYTVVICALLFGIISFGFISLMINMREKSIENTLAQSARDAALAGIEDAKILIVKANEDKKNGKDEHASDYIKAVEHKGSKGTGGSECYDIGWALGRTEIDSGDFAQGYLVQETSDAVGDVTMQAYTCVVLDKKPRDYLATISGDNPIRIIPLQTDGQQNQIGSVRISWYSFDNLGNQSTAFHNDEITVNGNNISFSDDASIPPIITAQIYQAGDNFKMTDFAESASSTTSRGTVWLVPSESSNTSNLANSTGVSSYYQSFPTMPASGVTAENTSTIIESSALVDSNNHNDTTIHQALPVTCADETYATTNNLDYLCSTILKLPQPKLGNRSNNDGTLILVLTLPYNQPTTDIKVEMADSTMFDGGGYKALEFKDVQTVVDSTGRANNVYARVESRIEFYNPDYPTPDYAVTLGSGAGTKGSLWKDFSISTAAGAGCWYSYYDDGGAWRSMACTP